MADYFTINFHSNFADYVRKYGDRNHVSYGVIEKLDASANTFIKSLDYYYDRFYKDTVYNYSGHSYKNNLIMFRYGYLPTRYWNTKADGSGIRFFEANGSVDSWSGTQIAETLGIEAYSEVTIDLYPEWIPQTKIWYKGSNNTVWASGYEECEDTTKTCITPSGVVIANAESSLFKDAIKCYGSPRYPAAWAIVLAYEEYGETEHSDDDLATFVY